MNKLVTYVSWLVLSELGKSLRRREIRGLCKLLANLLVHYVRERDIL